MWVKSSKFDDERNDLRDDGTALWSQAGVSHVGEVALGALRAAGAFAAFLDLVGDLREKLRCFRDELLAARP